MFCPMKWPYGFPAWLALSQTATSNMHSFSKTSFQTWTITLFLLHVNNESLKPHYMVYFTSHRVHLNGLKGIQTVFNANKPSCLFMSCVAAAKLSTLFFSPLSQRTSSNLVDVCSQMQRDGLMQIRLLIVMWYRRAATDWAFVISAFTTMAVYKWKDSLSFNETRNILRLPNNAMGHHFWTIKMLSLNRGQLALYPGSWLYFSRMTHGS